MQQRRLRLGDILDDYCPRERRITNHAVVAMIDDQVKQTRCTTCDADHEYRQARIPPPRRKKDALVPVIPADMPDYEQQEVEDDAAFTEGEAVEAAIDEQAALDEQPVGAESADAEDTVPEPREDDGPVHRRLIRAQLPRPEGQQPERKTPDFTVRQPGSRGREFDGNRPGGGGGGGQRHGRGRRAARGPQGPFTGPPRFGGGGPRQNSPQGQRQNGNRPQGNQRGSGRPPQGQQRGPGRKRGR